KLQVRIQELEEQVKKQSQTAAPASNLAVGQQSAGLTTYKSDSLAVDNNPTAQITPAPAPTTPAPKPDPFAFADWTWLTGNSRQKDFPLDSKVFTGEFRADVNYTEDFNSPKDNTIVGSSEIFRSGEVQVTQLGIGGDFHWQNVRGRLLTQFGMYSQ